MPEGKAVTQEGLERVENRLSKRITNNEIDIKLNREAIIELRTMYGALAKLPEAITSLEKTIVQINQNLEGLAEKINDIKDDIYDQKKSIDSLKQENISQNAEIVRVDNKGKIDWIHAVTENFWKILLAVVALYVAIKTTI